MRPLLASAVLGFLVSTPASAASTRYTVDWSAANGGGVTVGSVTMRTVHLGGTNVRSGTSYPGLYIGQAAADDARIEFSSKVSEFCWYASGQNVGEVVTMTTNSGGRDTYRVVDTGTVNSTLVGNQVSWDGVVSSDQDETLTCVANTGGFTQVTLDHNGVTGSGLVLTRRIWVDGAACTPTTWYADDDSDGYGDSSVSTSACTAPADYVAFDGDCDDDDDATYPGATEIVADGIDQSCDGKEICYVDADDDGWRTGDTVTSSDADCTDSGEALAVEDAGDCDDGVASVYPGAAEVAYDGVDQDCDGEDWCDVDADGYDDPRCGGMDCADEDVAINPAASETWYDGVDADCDGWSDFDADYDGFDDDEDCDDADPAIRPDAVEIWYDGVDQDCAGDSDYDQDGDGYEALANGGTDCDDLSAVTWPGAPELADGLDNDCNGLAETDDSDADGLSDELELELGLDPDSDDSDGDGVLDRDELGDPEDPTDSDGDGVIDALDADDDDDGIDSATEVAQSLKTLDSDTDGTPDHLDLDSDDDGFEDAFEGDVDSDFDGVPDYIDVDSDEDGVPDAEEFDGDTDGDGIEDRLDPDDDGDGFATAEELSWDEDLDGDGVPNHLDDDSDGDGIPDVDEGWADVDCDGIMDAAEVDAGDGACAQEVVTGFQSGCSSASAPAGLGGLGLGLLLLLGVRRRRD